MVGDGDLLWWWVLNEFDALFDIALETFRASLNELLLLLGHTLEDVVGLIRAAGLYLLSASFAEKEKVIVSKEYLLREKQEQRRTRCQLPWQWHRLQGHRAGRRK